FQVCGKISTPVYHRSKAIEELRAGYKRPLATLPFPAWQAAHGRGQQLGRARALEIPVVGRQGTFLEGFFRSLKQRPARNVHHSAVNFPWREHCKRCNRSANIL